MKKVLTTLFIISTAVLLLWGGIRAYNAHNMINSCTGYLERAAKANSIEMAEKDITRAIEYLEKNNLTTGYVSVFFKKPKNDIEYWYKNLKVAQEQLQNTEEDISGLEESNILMKLRETLIDTDDKGTKIICPEGISVYPNNVPYFWMGLLSFIGVCVFGMCSLYYESICEKMYEKHVKGK